MRLRRHAQRGAKPPTACWQRDTRHPARFGRACRRRSVRAGTERRAAGPAVVGWLHVLWQSRRHLRLSQRRAVGAIAAEHGRADMRRDATHTPCRPAARVEDCSPEQGRRVSYGDHLLNGVWRVELDKELNNLAVAGEAQRHCGTGMRVAERWALR